jgi:hypothetical protein
MSNLADVLRREFTDTEIHGFIIAAEHPDNRGATHWEKLRKAAIEAANCVDCANTGRR